MSSNSQNSASNNAQSDEKPSNVVSFHAMEKLTTNVKELAQRSRFFSRFFPSIFKGNRNFFDTFGYPNQIVFEQCLGLYSRGGLAKRIVNMPANAVWSRPPVLLTKNDEGKLQLINEFTDPWAFLFNKLGAHAAFENADRLAGMAPYSIVLIGFDDVSSASRMSQPVRKGAKPVYFRAYSYLQAQISSYEEDVTNPRYGMPKTYKLNPNEQTSDGLSKQVVPAIAGKAKPTTPNIEVHASRIIHITDDALENPLYGHPRLINVYNHLLDLIKVVGGAAETFWITGNRGLHVDVDKDVKLKPEDAEALGDEIQDYVDNLSRIIRTRGVEVNNLGSDVADPSGTFKVLISSIAGATGIPQRSLIGAEAGQLASEQDKANWVSYVEDRRLTVAEPIYLKPLIKTMQDIEYLPTTTDPIMKWPLAYRMSPLENAQTAAQKARVLANATRALPEGQTLATVEELREVFGLNEVRIGD